jgi:hypothetical protein
MADNPTVPSTIPSGAGSAATPPPAASTGDLITESKDGVLEYLYNSLPHKVEIYLQNTGEVNAPEEKRHRINPSSIVNLSLVETLNDWVVTGSLTFLYVPEGTTIKNKGGQTQSTKVAGARDTGKEISSYMFRADGFDYLRVCIKPINKSKNKKANIADSGKSIPELMTEDSKWILSYLFSITNIEDINDVPGLKGPMGPYMKCIKLSFHDFRYQILKTTNLEYSTALSPDAKQETLLYNKGGIPTGKAMLEIFNKALTNPENGGSQNLTIPPNPEKWDDGIGELFYTSPAQYNAEDDVEYLLANHVSSAALGSTQEAVGPPNPNQPRDMCLLHTERPASTTQIESICLSPLTKFFQQAGAEFSAPGPLQYEHFYVTGDTDGSSGTMSVFKAPVGAVDNNVDIKTAKYGQIISYSFVDIAPSINAEEFRTTPVHSVDLRERKFKIENKTNDVIAARKAIADGYLSKKVYLEKEAGEKNFLLQIHESKKRVNVFPTFSLNADNPLIRQKNGLHKLLYNGVFQNQCICFSVLGLTLRESGTFIAIDKTKGSSSNDYNNKLYGQWFVIRVDHIFEGGQYINTIYAVKLHRSQPLEVPFQHVL